MKNYLFSCLRIIFCEIWGYILFLVLGFLLGITAEYTFFLKGELERLEKDHQTYMDFIHSSVSYPKTPVPHHDPYREAEYYLNWDDR